MNDLGNNGFTHMSLSSRVEEYLKIKIFKGEFKGGDRILESKVADRLNISRAPVREAIKALENQGLVNSVARKGSFIVKYNSKDIKELYKIRVLLENEILTDLIENDKLSKNDYDKLSSITDKMVSISQSAVLGKDELVDIIFLDMSFHNYLYVKSGSKWMKKILTTVHHQLKLAEIDNDLQINNMENFSRQHYDIIENLKEKNLSGVKEAVSMHITAHYSKVLEN